MGTSERPWVFFFPFCFVLRFFFLMLYIRGIRSGLFGGWFYLYKGFGNSNRKTFWTVKILDFDSKVNGRHSLDVLRKPFLWQWKVYCSSPKVCCFSPK